MAFLAVSLSRWHSGRRSGCLMNRLSLLFFWSVVVLVGLPLQVPESGDISAAGTPGLLAIWEEPAEDGLVSCDSPPRLPPRALEAVPHCLGIPCCTLASLGNFFPREGPSAAERADSSCRIPRSPPV